MKADFFASLRLCMKKQEYVYSEFYMLCLTAMEQPKLSIFVFLQQYHGIANTCEKEAETHT